MDAYGPLWAGYANAGAKDILERAKTGRSSPREALQIIENQLSVMRSTVICTYDPSNAFEPVTCNEPVGALKSSVRPSTRAAHDVTLWLGMYRCDSEATHLYAKHLRGFAETSPFCRNPVSKPTAYSNSPRDQAFAQIYRNCARMAGEGSADDWCTCYVGVVQSLQLPDQVVSDLANNPFVQGKTYIEALRQYDASADNIVHCAPRGRHHDWRLARSKRTTACLLGQKPLLGGMQSCIYRAAWGDFTVGWSKCPNTITSRQWGFERVDCDGSPVAETNPDGPVAWDDGITNFIDYEKSVPDGFVPPVLKSRIDNAPLTIRLLKEQ